jgi:prenyltransferase beta subunit
MSRSAGLLFAAVMSVAATVAASVAPAVGAQTDPPAGASRSGAAVSWLADQFVDGERLQVTFGSDSFDDAGLTIDALFAFAAAGVAPDQAVAATEWLSRSAVTTDYIGDGSTEAYAGPTAKLALVAEIRYVDPTSWGDDGVDLIDRLRSLELPDGHFADVSSFGDFSNSIGQSLAIMALERGFSASDESVTFLLRSECPDGGFALELDPEPGACVSSVDATSFVIQALSSIDASTRDLGQLDARQRATAFLMGGQQPGGGFGAELGETPNANSTGLAAQALTVAGENQPAADARVFLASLQQDCSDSAATRGAVGFDSSGFDLSNAPRATAQAVLGLTGAGFATLMADGSTALTGFDCPPLTSTPNPVGVPTSPTAVVGSVTQTPAAVPVRATPTFTG